MHTMTEAGTLLCNRRRCRILCSAWLMMLGVWMAAAPVDVASSSASSSSTGAASSTCGAIEPLPAVVNVAILVHTNASVGVLPDGPWVVAPPDRSIYAGLINAIYQGLQLYTEAMDRQGAMPLTNGGNVTFNFVYINLGFVDWDNAATSFPAVLPSYFALTSQVTDPVASVALGGPFPFIIAPLFTPSAVGVLLFNDCEDRGTCMVLVPFATSTQLFACQVGVPDCERRQRLPGIRRFNHVLSLSDGGLEFNQVPLEQCHALGVRSIVIIGQAQVGDNTFVQDCAAHTEEQAAHLGIQVKELTMMVHGPSGPETHVFPRNLTAMEYAMHVATLNPDALLMIIGPSNPAYVQVAAFFSALRDLDWSPKLVSWAGSGEAYIHRYMEDPTFILHHLSISVFDTRTTGPSNRNLLTPSNFELHPATLASADGSVPAEDGPAVFARAFDARFKDAYPLGFPFTGMGESEDPLTGYSCLLTIQKLIEQALTADVPTLVAASTRLNLPAAYTKLQFSTTGEITAQVIVKQYVHTDTPTLEKPFGNAIISPYNIGVPAVYPLPTWKERVFNPRFYSTSNERVMVAVNSVVMALCLWVLCIVVQHRARPVIRAATPSFCALVICGVLMMLSSNFFETLYVTDAHCSLQVWLLTIGFSLTFSALFIKTFRIYKLFSTQRLHAVRMPESELLVAVAAVMLVDILLNSLWQGLYGMKAALHTPDPLRPFYNYYSCDYTHTLPFVYTHLALKAAMLLFGSYLAFAVRRAPTHFNESLHISLCIYNCVIVICFIVPILSAGLGGRTTRFMIRAFAIMFVSVSTVGALFAPKIWTLRLFGSWAGSDPRTLPTPMPNLPLNRTHPGYMQGSKAATAAATAAGGISRAAVAGAARAAGVASGGSDEDKSKQDAAAAAAAAASGSHQRHHQKSPQAPPHLPHAGGVELAPLPQLSAVHLSHFASPALPLSSHSTATSGAHQPSLVVPQPQPQQRRPQAPPHYPLGALTNNSLLPSLESQHSVAASQGGRSLPSLPPPHMLPGARPSTRSAASSVPSPPTSPSNLPPHPPVQRVRIHMQEADEPDQVEED